MWWTKDPLVKNTRRTSYNVKLRIQSPPIKRVLNIEKIVKYLVFQVT